MRRALVREEEDRPDDRRPGEHQVDVQAPAPVEVFGQQAAEQEADEAAGTGDGPVHAERLTPLLRVAEGGGQQGQRGRGQQSGEGSLARPGGDQHGEVDRGATDRGGHGEADEAGEERHLAAEEVAEAAAEQQQAAEGERVGGDDPLPVDVAEVQGVLR